MQNEMKEHLAEEIKWCLTRARGEEDQESPDWEIAAEEICFRLSMLAEWLERQNGVT